MRITADSNLLVRAAVDDHPQQSEQARTALRDADLVVLTLPALCEFVWVARRAYRRPPAEISASIRALIDSPSAQADHPAVEAGLAMLERGGDFADGVIAFEGRRLGGEVFVSFDRDALRLVEAGGGRTHLPGD